MVINNSGMQPIEQEHMWRALAEEIKLPFMHVARLAELGDPSVMKHISYTADAALKFVDSYLLSIELQKLPYLELEPISAPAILQNVIDSMNKLAIQYTCELELSVTGVHGPIMADRQALEAAFTNLTHAFIESATPEKRRVVLAAYQNKRGLLCLGVYADHTISSSMFRRARALTGRAHRSMSEALSGTGARLFVADSLLQAQALQLGASRHASLQGLATCVQYSKQLALV